MIGAYRYTGRPLPKLLEALRHYVTSARRGDAGGLGGISAVADTLECCYEPLTLAVRVCSDCRRYIGVREWIGTDAHPDRVWTLTHDICDGCLPKYEDDDTVRGSSATQGSAGPLGVSESR